MGFFLSKEAYKHEVINGFASFPYNNNDFLIKIMKKLQLGEGREASFRF